MCIRDRPLPVYTRLVEEKIFYDSHLAWKSLFEFVHFQTDSVETVSYTHLDVYKRQASGHHEPHRRALQETGGSPQPVSYTHLTNEEKGLSISYIPDNFSIYISFEKE